MTKGDQESYNLGECKSRGYHPHVPPGQGSVVVTALAIALSIPGLSAPAATALAATVGHEQLCAALAAAQSVIIAQSPAAAAAFAAAVAAAHC